MPRPQNFIFCRYAITVGEDQLTPDAQLVFLQENQGNEVEHGRLREGIQPSCLWTDPAPVDFDENRAISFHVGYKPGVRTRQRYDRDARVVDRRIEPDDHTKLAMVVLVPALGAMAVQDRSGDEHLPARQGISAFRSIVRLAGNGDGNLDVIHATDGDVRRALDEWDLTEYLYTVKPLNPLPGTPLSRRRTAAYESEGVGKEIGRVYPKEGQEMHAGQGVIAETRDLAEDGYGQIGLRGETPDGHSAHIPKPKFYEERAKNLAEREKARLMRVQIDENDGEGDFSTIVARALVRFYG